MKIDLEKLQKEYFPAALESIKEIIKIPSVRGEKAPQAPFGENTKKVLDFAINLAKELGFKAYQDPENRYGYVEYGTGEKIFAILGHLDVVPTGDLTKWEFEPFNPQVKDGKLLGRGSFDDKGPTIINLYALKYLKDNGFEPDYRIRLIFGLTEETDWSSITSYMETEGTPDLGYTPDGEFPVVYAEKGILNADIVGGGENFTLIGGEAYNSVNDVVKYQGPEMSKIEAILTAENIENYVEKDMLIIKGKSSHGSLPERGINAALEALNAIAHVNSTSKIAKFVEEHLYRDYSFSKIFSTMHDESGNLTVNNGIVEINQDKTRLTLNLRVPITYHQEDVVKPLTTELAKFDLQLTDLKWENPVHMPKDSTMIQNIMQVYREVTGDHNAQPLAIGGGTYAKAMPNCVAFGAEFDIEESTMHAYNEYVKIDDLRKMLEIYTKSIPLLTKINK
ncbi:Sapep family Mn(2+)-dependent dipeptidase [Spiroplasma eriocheiris]|uniref:Dipeptidase PepV n=1 Tax=Spiroplasma eriocheiris TaxID=315358 RepID=A0A0H3XI08_9MOLU|nr:Sapep family Mn(2+)-dependent dipeptidase [Spiroplasma eriocheiris]AHF58016.1 putative Xaa-His dipeptidase [Spiroplasma eriocheiris CCTCC M 207170]AKM54458.1 dipeptidase PepV [Spiroplasma eriocheiris]